MPDDQLLTASQVLGSGQQPDLRLFNNVLLVGPIGTRALSYEVFASKEALERALRDIRCVQQGLPLPSEEDGPPPRDKYDDALDAELEKLDQ